jgi:hypothetical protein
MIRIQSGNILIYRLYDVAHEINLPGVEERLHAEARRLKIERMPFSKALEFANPPVVFQLKSIEWESGGRRHPVNIRGKAYDFGVLSIILEIPVRDVTLSEFEEIAAAVSKSETLKEASRNHLNQTISALGSAIVGSNLSRFEEDYTVFFVEALEPALSADDFLLHCDVSRLMYGEQKILSSRMKEDLLQYRYSYFEDDLVILNWDNALMIEPSGSMEIADILEFANAQLLELRYYDDVVDRELGSIQRDISEKGAPSIWKIKKYERLAAEVMKTIAELMGITEKIDSALKVTEDVYYAKIYLAALRLFRVKDWEGSIKKKLDIASNTYDMLYREIATKRTELLELTIVILIILEIVIFMK